MARHRLLPAGEAGRGMAQLRADRGGTGLPHLLQAEIFRDRQPVLTSTPRLGFAALLLQPLPRGEQRVCKRKSPSRGPGCTERVSAKEAGRKAL
jgi:hypothetical protein